MIPSARLRPSSSRDRVTALPLVPPEELCGDGFRLHRREQFRAAVDYVASHFQLTSVRRAVFFGSLAAVRDRFEHAAASASLRTLVSPLG